MTSDPGKLTLDELELELVLVAELVELELVVDGVELGPAVPARLIATSRGSGPRAAADTGALGGPELDAGGGGFLIGPERSEGSVTSTVDTTAAELERGRRADTADTFPANRGIPALEGAAELGLEAGRSRYGGARTE